MISNPDYPKKNLLYSCNNCLFYTSNKKDYNRHVETIKHKSNVSQCFSIEIPKTKTKSFTCNCGKVYNDNSGLWRHKNKDKFSCRTNENIIKNNNIRVGQIYNKLHDKDELIIMLIKENTEFKNMMMEQQNMMMKIIENRTNI